ncbi:hypothetical protein [Acetobacterium woodii]|uniref:Uncharacterized protein n=1 Tax=Acetobacterium woodii (strain ATCC 29683 / DSM 1030 / JCM 2381 / KCTC 1655 / WB1) TaxID=931626 RepID=H6LGI8_ACEWD|nr:hypothetical protein [Acetobacterium woodii]AFA48316.1 hypothetical protein Awo_c15340 [Acetobacterium woodii DSM 1030]
MDTKIFLDFPYDLNMEILNEKLNLNNRESMLDIVEPLFEMLQKIAKPKAIYFKAQITKKSESSVCVDEAIFKSQLLRGYVAAGEVVYPYIVTVGTELDDYAKTLDDSMDQFMIDEMMNLLVNIGKVFVFNEVKKETGWEAVQDYVPGNGEDWSTEEQTRLFKMFGNETQKIGVTLGEHAFVLPGRSTIGILSRKK